MYGREARLPVDIVYGTQSLVSSTVDTYAQKSCRLLEESFNRVRDHLSAGHHQSKKTYMTNVSMVILIKLEILSGYWILSLDKDKSRKFHHPWKGPYQIVKKISDCDYHIKSVINQSEQIVHFNRLKPCKPGTRFYQSPAEDNQSDSLPSVNPMTIPRVVGDSLELVDCEMTNPRGTTRARQPPACFNDFISH